MVKNRFFDSVGMLCACPCGEQAAMLFSIGSLIHLHYNHYSPLWSSSATILRQSVVCICSLRSCSPSVSSGDTGRISVVLSVCSSVSSTLSETFSLPLSSLLAVSVLGLCTRHGCLRIVRRCLLRRDWLQCRVRLRCHWLIDFWASTLS